MQLVFASEFYNLSQNFIFYFPHFIRFSEMTAALSGASLPSHFLSPVKNDLSRNL